LDDLRNLKVLNMNEQSRVYTCTSASSTRVRKPSWKKTVSITLPSILIERTRKQGLNISRVTEQALSSILDYLQVQNTKPVLDETSCEEVSVDRAGFEPATSALRMRRSYQTELPAHAASF
jgi:post-segregation antitoxin (ccd killing protein)